jgi:hypothetical protein
VQFRAAPNGSVGFRTEWTISEVRPTRRDELDRWLSGMRILQRHQSLDAARIGETVFAVAPRSLAATLDLIGERIEQSGYRNDALTSRRSADPAVVVYRKGPRDVVLTAAARANETAVAIHYLTEK